jgi:hypothetical protein
MNDQVNSNMDDFEKQLEQNNIVDLDSQIDASSRLSEDKINSIDISNLPSVPSAPQQIPQTVKVQKNIVLAFISDATGCGFIRCFQPFSYLNFVFGKNQTLLPIISSAFIQDQNILVRTRTIYFQRQMSPEHMRMVAWYKQHQSNLKYKMVWEMDDFIWWEDKERKVHGVPPYNFGAPGITEAVKSASIEIMKMMDELVVSTQPLADYIKNELNIPVPVTVIKNHVAKYFWKDGLSKKKTEKIVKPKIIYTGSPTHYHNDLKHPGDWENSAWREFIVKNVKENKIDFTCFGGLPFFFEEIKDKIKVISWLNSFQYHLAVLGEKADFGIMPLVPNWFNYCKSNLKFLEYSAAGVLAIGTYFKENTPYQGPYHDMRVKLDSKASLKEIQETFEYYSDPTHYNEMITWQNNYLNENGHWLESQKYVNEFLKVI